MVDNAIKWVGVPVTTSRRYAENAPAESRTDLRHPVAGRKWILILIFLTNPTVLMAQQASTAAAEEFFDRLGMDNLIEQSYGANATGPIQRRREIPLKTVEKMKTTFRAEMVGSIAHRYSADELSRLVSEIEGTGELPADFKSWLDPALVMALQQANNVHLNQRSGNSNFRIESSDRIPDE